MVVVSDTETDPAKILPGIQGSVLRPCVVTPREVVTLVPPPTCVLLDWRAARDRALHVVELLRGRDPAAPAILVVLGEDALSELDEGWQVDDVVLRTASAAEVSARVRLRTAAAARAAGRLVDGIEHGPLRIERSTHSVLLDGQEVSLTFREFELLAYLAERPDRVCGRAELLHVVWGKSSMKGARTIDVHVARLRRKLGHRHGALLETVRSVGYRLRVRPPAEWAA